MPYFRFEKLIALALTAVLAFGSLAGCEQGNSESTTAQGGPTTAETTIEMTRFTDMAGREILLNGPADRVVAVTAADCEILYALGAGDTLVGRGEYCDYPAEVLDIPSVQSGEGLNLEQILALEPQVVLMGSMAQTLEQAEALDKAGIPVVISDAQDIAGVYEAIGMIGLVVGKTEEADALVADMAARFDALKARAPAGEDKPTVYFEVSPLEWGLWTAGSGTFMNEIAEMLGLANTFADVSGWAEISQEQVLERNPDYVVTITMYYGEGPRPEEEIAAREGWQGLAAVTEGHVIWADSNEISRPGPRLATAAELLFGQVHGEA